MTVIIQIIIVVPRANFIRRDISMKSMIKTLLEMKNLSSKKLVHEVKITGNLLKKSTKNNESTVLQVSHFLSLHNLVEIKVMILKLSQNLIEKR